ncbi:charged multivesicular body protein 7 [Cynoglossus semilaevis]|uniref:Charged multivesicular body protein 7 n=1 Tax=Cynoglossus semilaevis TaxID=244447 RepID=A0A3P8WMD7_CYNSE|nr:charged multivesicular body protein 7 [Cynoglossus semilaevis]XP_024909670.1 charged multivesicular body protein 7 [Cynoglossus semilaevis]XP_024909671.1 charged multivesicular body protein 7 [Cynoglossus semilaevis]
MSDSVGITLPPDWDDDERMNFMFSDFKENRDVNASEWDSKMDFWTALVLRSCRERRTVCVSLQELNKTFRRKEKSPLGLATVVQSMVRCGKIQRESEFAVDCGWLSWAMGLLLVKPLKWTLSSLLGSGQLPLQESFVVHELVKEKAAELLRAYGKSEFSRRAVLSFSEVRGLSSDVCADESTLCMALLQLQREKRATVALHEGEKIVKFGQRGSVSPVNDVDVGIYQLQQSEKLLEDQVKKLGLEADRCRDEVRFLLREGKKSQALRSLRGCKRLEKRSDNLSSNLETIRGILDRIAQSETDKMVIQAYQAGVSALKVALKDVTVERAENLVDQIQELCDTQDEVNQTLSSGVSGTDVDMDDLEDELNSLLEESNPDAASGLPAVPTAPLLPSGGRGLSADGLLSSLPAVPQGLVEQLDRLTLTPSGVQPANASSKKLEPA